MSAVLSTRRGAVGLLLGMGLSVGLGAYLLTGWVGPVARQGGPCMTYTEAYFDPWTGEPVPGSGSSGMILPPAGCGPSDRPQPQPLPASMSGRRAIPVPVGFVVGALLALGVLTVIGRRPANRSQPGPAIPG